MKKTLLALVLVAGARVPALAQQTFDLPESYVNRAFYFDFPGHNQVQLRFKSIRDLYATGSLDSTFRVCLEDLSPLRDSLSDELTLKRVDYTVDPAGRKLIRLHRTTPPASGFLVDHGRLSALKLGQDTLHLVLPVTGTTHRYEIYVLVNDITELPGLLAGGLDAKLDTLKHSVYVPGLSTGNDNHWETGSDRRLHLQNDPTLSEDHPDGARTINHDRISDELDVQLSTYKNIFVPSFFIGFKVVFNSSTDLLHKDSKFKYYLALGWEPQFFFQGAPGKLNTCRNDMLTLYFSQVRKVPPPGEPVGKPGLMVVNPTISLSYLINQNGPFYEPHTFRVGVGSAHFGGQVLQVQPVLYFNNFFKGVTPGVAVSIGF